MTRILSILDEFIKEIQQHNPYKLVLKGGTALSLFYLNRHRESEDLDFDSDISNLKRYKEIEKYFIGILNELKKRHILKHFKLGKSGLASTNRYHMKIELETYKTFQTKIDVDFVKLPNKLERKGKLYFYSKERIFITKMITFINRKEFKDLYDISYLLPRVNINKFIHNLNVVRLIEKLLKIIEREDILKLYKYAFRNVDLRFRDLKQSQVDNFVSKLMRNLRILRNKINHTTQL